MPRLPSKHVPHPTKTRALCWPQVSATEFRTTLLRGPLSADGFSQHTSILVLGHLLVRMMVPKSFPIAEPLERAG
ncbi:hypothetical protein D9M70_358590 [compost metagenome]